MRAAIITEKGLHPHAQPQDYIKLIFQSEFGPGHLIADPSFSHSRLAEEWRQVRYMPAEPPQDIGGGYLRLYIKGLDENRLERVNTAFVTSANLKSGTEDGFMKKLELFVEMAQQSFLILTLPGQSRRWRNTLPAAYAPPPTQKFTTVTIPPPTEW